MNCILNAHEFEIPTHILNESIVLSQSMQNLYLNNNNIDTKYFDAVPIYLINKIFLYLKVEDMGSLTRVTQEFRGIIQSIFGKFSKYDFTYYFNRTKNIQNFTSYINAFNQLSMFLSKKNISNIDM